MTGRRLAGGVAPSDAGAQMLRKRQSSDTNDGLPVGPGVWGHAGAHDVAFNGPTEPHAAGGLGAVLRESLSGKKIKQ